MIEAGRPCLELAQQLHAVEKAIGEAKRTLIHDHIEHCLDQVAGAVATREAHGSIGESEAISKYL
jgi:DNA-binding FrmR family transcriptional regulator